MIVIGQCVMLIGSVSLIDGRLRGPLLWKCCCCRCPKGGITAFDRLSIFDLIIAIVSNWNSFNFINVQYLMRTHCVKCMIASHASQDHVANLRLRFSIFVCRFLEPAMTHTVCLCEWVAMRCESWNVQNGAELQQNVIIQIPIAYRGLDSFRNDAVGYAIDCLMNQDNRLATDYSLTFIQSGRD